MHEAEFIAALRKLPLHPGARRLEDDCAVLEIGGETLIITTDSMAAGTHWKPDADPFDIAWKLVATNLSDLAAKGAEPVGLLLNHSLDEGSERFLEGLSAILSRYDVPLLGGDTIATKEGQTHGLTAIGRATHTPVPSRAGALETHNLYITGPVGRAMLGFEGDTEHAKDFNRPLPLLAEGQELAPLVSAMMDVSDGLLLDALRMAQASGVTLNLDRQGIPVADSTRRHDCFRWGDDYALLFTAPADASLPTHAICIGEVLAQSGAPILLDGEPPDGKNLGYQHQ
ncbi:MAG: thiamine-phosphate kinase [Erythrobacter sp.]